jgi:hypothetical protein
MIFLSYTWREQSIAREVDARLRLEGLAVWIDFRDLRSDENILDQLDSAILRSNLFVVVRPSGHAGSRWMRTELSIARAYRKAILPFRSEMSAFVGQVKTMTQREVTAGCVGSFFRKIDRPTIVER